MKVKPPLRVLASKVPRPRLGMTLLGILALAGTVLAPGVAATAAASAPTITTIPLTVNMGGSDIPTPFTVPYNVEIKGQDFTPGGAVLAEVLDVTANVYVNGDNHYLYATKDSTGGCRPIAGRYCGPPITIAGGQFDYWYAFYNSAYSSDNPAAWPPCGHLMRVRAYDYQQGLWSNVVYYIACQTAPPPR